MKKIVIFGGTIEGRQIVEALEDTDIKLYVCVATYYAATLLPSGEQIEVLVGRLDEEGMEQLFEEVTPDLCLDATHPYAVEVTNNIMLACDKKNVECIRVVRDKDLVSDDKVDDKMWFYSSVEEAAKMLSDTEGKIFITTGSKELNKYTVIPDYKERCVARVLSTNQVIGKCNELGFQGKNLIAMQGPFSTEMNELMLRECDAKWLVTKSSGLSGGYVQKCEAANRLGISIVVIGRPVETSAKVLSLADTFSLLKERFGIQYLKPVIHIVSMGPGNINLLTKEAIEVLEQADVYIGAERVLDIWNKDLSKPRFASYKKEEILEYIKSNPQFHNIAICYSGDVGFCSGAKTIYTELADYEVHIISGISSISYFLDKIHTAWDGVHLDSCHGKELDIVSLLEGHERVCVLLGDEDSVAKMCREIKKSKITDVIVTVGSRLSYENEEIIVGNTDDFTRKKFDTLSIAYFERIG